MRNLLYGGVAILMTAQMLYADELAQRKAELEKQIRELEAQQKQQTEIEVLEQKLNALKANAPTTQSKQPAPQRAYPTQTYQTPPYPQYPQERITQKMRDGEVQKTFGKNRNGVLLGIGIGGMLSSYRGNETLEQKLTALGLRLGYQKFPSNTIFGWRIYLDGYLGRHEEGSEVMQKFGSWNIDALVDINIPNTYSYFGLFAGLGYGMMMFNYSNSYKIWSNGGAHEWAELQLFTAFLNFGISFTGSAKHRIELYCKIPITNEYNDGFHWKTSVLPTLMYQYTF